MSDLELFKANQTAIAILKMVKPSRKVKSNEREKQNWNDKIAEIERKIKVIRDWTTV